MEGCPSISRTPHCAGFRSGLYEALPGEPISTPFSRHSPFKNKMIFEFSWRIAYPLHLDFIFMGNQKMALAPAHSAFQLPEFVGNGGFVIGVLLGNGREIINPNEKSIDNIGVKMARPTFTDDLD
jgi:hypothetical protein